MSTGVLKVKLFTLKSVIQSFAVFLCLVVFYAAPLDDRPLFSRGEAREALVIKEMFEQNNFILPLRNNEDIPSKPPMFHWSAVASSIILDTFSEASIRLPSAIYSALTLCVLFLVLRYLQSTQCALMAVAILATTVEWISSSSHARVDMCFSAWLSLSLLFSFVGIEKKEKNQRYWIFFFAAGVSAGFATLSKGPAGLLFPVMIIGLFFLAKYRLSISAVIKKSPMFPLLVTFLIATLVASIWYFLAYQKEGMTFINRQLFEENFARMIETDKHDPGHQKPFFFTFVFLFTGFLPWSLLFPLAMNVGWKSRKKLFSPNFTLPPFTLFCLVWVIVFLVVVTMSVSKRSVYLLPAYPPLVYLFVSALLTAYRNEIDFKNYKRVSEFSLIFLGIIVFVIGISSLILLLEITSIDWIVKLTSLETKRTFSVLFESLQEHPSVPFLIPVVALGLMFSAKILKKGKLAQTIASLTISVILLTLSINHILLPSIAKRYSAKDFTHKVNETVPLNAKLYSYQHVLFPVIFYSFRTHIHPADDKTLDVETNLYLILREDNLSHVLKRHPNARVLFTSNEFAAGDEGRLTLLYILPTD